MGIVNFRAPDEICAFVKSIAAKRKVSDSTVWREIAVVGCRHYSKEEGISTDEGLRAMLDLIFRTTVQSLTISRRLAGFHDEGLVAAAKEDASAILGDTGSPT